MTHAAVRGQAPYWTGITQLVPSQGLTSTFALSAGAARSGNSLVRFPK
jgi:hypothetical protein